DRIPRFPRLAGNDDTDDQQCQECRRAPQSHHWCHTHASHIKRSQFTRADMTHRGIFRKIATSSFPFRRFANIRKNGHETVVLYVASAQADMSSRTELHTFFMTGERNGRQPDWGGLQLTFSMLP